MISVKSLCSGSIPEFRFEADIVTRFQNYFSLFDGRNNAEDPIQWAKVEEAVADLYDPSVLDLQLDMARDMLKQELIITVNKLEKCLGGKGRVFYFIKVTSPRNQTVQQHITGFATINAREQVTQVETKVKVIRCRGSVRMGNMRNSRRRNSELRLQLVDGALVTSNGTTLS